MGCLCGRSPNARASALEAAADGDCVALAASIARSGAAEVCASRDAAGDTPLHGAALHGAVDAAQLLIASGADACAVNGRGQTPLHLACMHAGAAELVAALLDAGADVDARTAGDGRSALHNAAEYGDAVTVSALLRAGAAFKQPTRSGVTARELAARRTDGDGAEVAELLRSAERRASDELRRRCAEMGTTPPPKSPQYAGYRTPLHYGADGGQLEIGTLQH